MRAHDHPPAGGSLAEPLGDATEALAAAWRATRAPAIATALVAVSEAYASFFDALPKRGGCFDRVLRDHDRMLSVLLGSVTRVEEVEATRRLRAIADVAGSDPRLAHHLARWSRAYVRTELPREAGASGQFARERARLLAAGPPPARPSEPASDLVRAAHAALVEGATALLASVPRRREALRLLRDVYAHPTDLPRRLVLADALLELGDPWGELITLQCARTRGETVDATREATLLAAGAQAWLGRLAKAVLVDHAGVAFEEGFPSRVVPRLDASVTGIPEWSTVRSFVSPGFRYGRTLRTLGLLTRTSAKEASVLVRVGPEGRVPLLEGTNDALERLALSVLPRTGEARSRVLDAWAARATFARLQRLDLDDHVPPDDPLFAAALALATAPFGRGLAALGFRASASVLLRHASAAYRTGRAFPRLYGNGEEWLVFDRATDTMTLHLVLAAQASTWADDLRASGVARVRLELGPRVPRIMAASLPAFVELVPV